MAEAANSSQLKEAFTGHLEQTEGHLRLLGEIFTASSPIVETVNECMHRRSILMKIRWWSWEHGFLRE
jgi:ferritin-like metal-binding protein YciE